MSGNLPVLNPISFKKKKIILLILQINFDHGMPIYFGDVFKIKYFSKFKPKLRIY